MFSYVDLLGRQVRYCETATYRTGDSSADAPTGQRLRGRQPHRAAVSGVSGARRRLRSSLAARSGAGASTVFARSPVTGSISRSGLSAPLSRASPSPRARARHCVVGAEDPVGVPGLDPFGEACVGATGWDHGTPLAPGRDEMQGSSDRASRALFARVAEFGQSGSARQLRRRSFRQAGRPAPLRQPTGLAENLSMH